jgi:hypothetical protein
MTAQRVAAIVARAGETVTLRRSPSTDATVKASIRHYRADELVGSIQQGDAEVHVAAADAGLASWPAPPRRNDKLIRDGKHLNVEACETRNFREDAALYVMRVRG